MMSPLRGAVSLLAGAVICAGLTACNREAAFDATTDARLTVLDGSWAAKQRLPASRGSSPPGPYSPPGSAAPLTDLWQQKVDAVIARELNDGDLDNNTRRCIPNGMPMASRAGALDIWIRPGAIMVLAENRDLRRIHVDGRQHTPEAELKLSYLGESIGTWQGDTLVVDTIGVMRSNEIGPGVGNVKAHIVERWTWSADTLTVDTTVEDAYAMTGPWNYSITYDRVPSGAIGESYCVQVLDRAFNSETGEQDFSFRGHGDEQTP